MQHKQMYLTCVYTVKITPYNNDKKHGCVQADMMLGKELRVCLFIYLLCSVLSACIPVCKKGAPGLITDGCELSGSGASPDSRLFSLDQTPT